uniref:Uncharacterized protein n=1 Tax=Sphaerodactylus townsendi TaxID=933632 RepID=A0ACB8GE93_9SAUR
MLSTGGGGLHQCMMTSPPAPTAAPDSADVSCKHQTGAAVLQWALGTILLHWHPILARLCQLGYLEIGIKGVYRAPSLVNFWNDGHLAGGSEVIAVRLRRAVGAYENAN